MPEQTSATALQRRRSLNPVLLLIILLLLLLLGFVLSKWMLDQCLAGLTPPAETTAQVLGITNLDVTSDLNPAKGGEVVNFTVTGDHDGPLENALIIFDTTGKGTIQSAPVGSGLCVKVSSTQATCTGVSLLSNDAINYVVPVVVDTTCGLLGSDRVGLDVSVNDTGVEDATADGDVGCVAATGSNSSSSSAGTTSSSGTGQSSTSSSTNTTVTANGSDDETNTAKSYSDQVAACYASANNVLLLAIGLPLLLLLVIYVIAEMNNRNRRTN